MGEEKANTIIMATPRKQRQYKIQTSISKRYRKPADDKVYVALDHPEFGAISGSLNPKELFSALARAGLIVPAKEV